MFDTEPPGTAASSQTITIQHDHATGTIIDGSTRGDGVWQIVEPLGWRHSQQIGIYVRGSRDRDANRPLIARTRTALEAAGFTVAEHIDDQWRPVAQRRSALDDRAEDRADNLTQRAGRAAAEAARRFDADHAITDGMTGEPVKLGHHSQRRHERDLERADAHRRAGTEASDYAAHLTDRAAGVQANAAYRANPRAMLRRIELLEVQRRGYDRALTGYSRTFRNNQGEIYHIDEYPPATGEHAERLRRDDARDAEEITYLQAELAAHHAAGSFVAWAPEHFQKDDGIKVSGHGWYRITRVNTKSASLDTNGQWPRTITWDKIAGRRRDGLQWDTPNGQPWPVELAQQVARWNNTAHRASLPSAQPGDETRHVRWAQRLVHGLPLHAADREVAAIAASITGTDEQRALAAAYLAVLERLNAGELVPAIAATLTPVNGTPAWRIPEHLDPQDRRAGPGWPHVNEQRFIEPGDLLVGYYEGVYGSQGSIVRQFCGPVAEVSTVRDRRERGEWVTITLTDGAAMEFRTVQHVLVHPAGTWEQPPPPAEGNATVRVYHIAGPAHGDWHEPIRTERITLDPDTFQTARTLARRIAAAEPRDTNRFARVTIHRDTDPDTHAFALQLPAAD